jgi:hypothetical protein
MRLAWPAKRCDASTPWRIWLLKLRWWEAHREDTYASPYHQ